MPTAPKSAVECPVSADDPFGGAEHDQVGDGKQGQSTLANSMKHMEIDGKALCEGSEVESNQGRLEARMVLFALALSRTGSSVLLVLGTAALLAAGGCCLVYWRRRFRKTTNFGPGHKRVGDDG